MSNLLREEVARRNLGTIDIATYLRTYGWDRLEHPSRDVSYWRRTVAAQHVEVLLPHHHDWSRSMTERVLLRCDGELRRLGTAFVLEHPCNSRLVAG